MNKYLVYVTGNETLGYDFMKNVVKAVQMGGTLKENSVPRMSFPHSIWFELETEEFKKNEPGFQYQTVSEIYTKDQLEEMEWDELKKVAKSVGVTGRDRQQVIRKYVNLTDPKEPLNPRYKFDDESDEVEQEETSTTQANEEEEQPVVEESSETESEEKPKRGRKKKEDQTE